MKHRTKKNSMVDKNINEDDILQYTNSPEYREKESLNWFVRLRWIAVLIAFVLSWLSCKVFYLLPEKNLGYLLVTILLLLIGNIIFSIWKNHSKKYTHQMIIQVVFDLCLLTVLLHFSGGIENQLFILYGFHVIIAGILLSSGLTYLLTIVALLLMTGLSLAELFEVIPHYTLIIFPHTYKKLSLHMAHIPVFVLGKLLVYSLFFICLARFIVFIMEHLRNNQNILLRFTRSLSTEKKKVEGVINSVGAGMVLLDKELRVKWFNKKITEWFRMNPHRIGEACPFLDGSVRDACFDCFAKKSIQSETVYQHEKCISDEKGGLRYYHITTTPIPNAEGVADQVVELIQDITERKKLEQKLEHAGKMSALGRLMAGITHEIGNPLSSIRTRLELMKKKQTPEFIIESLDLLHQQINRMARIVHNVAGLVRPSHAKWDVINIEDIIRESRQIVEMDRRSKNIKWNVISHPSNTHVSGIRDQLAQVFINIFINALDAMPEGGQIEIKIGLKDNKIHCMISDTGAGMDDKTRSQIFRAFFTTKKEGMGIGLALSETIVRSHGGELDVTTAPGAGSCFTIILPVHPDYHKE